MTKLCDINQGATEKLPPGNPDKSGIGAHYVDAYVATMNTTLADGTKVSCKRRGLKLTLRVGTKKGEGLLRRLAAEGDPVKMLNAALHEAAQSAGVQLVISGPEILIAP